MLKCSICYEKAVRPHVTICGHLFCYDHIRKWQNTSTSGTSNTCPVCRRKINSGNKGGLIEIFETAGNSGAKTDADLIDISDGIGPALTSLKQKWDQIVLENTRLQVKVRNLEEEIKQLRRERDIHMNQDINKADWESYDPSEAALYSSSNLAAPRFEGWGESCSVETELACSSPWKLDYQISVHSGPVHGIDVSSHLGIVASASWDRTCNLFDVNRKVTVGQLVGVHEKGLYGVAFSKTDEEILATCSSDHTCSIWNVRTCSCLCSFEDHADEVNGLSFHHSRNIIATASDDRSVIVWDVGLCESVCKLTGHRNSVYDVCFSPVSSLLASASFDWNTKLWDIRASQEVKSLEGHTDDVIGVDISSTGHLIATGSDDGTCRVTDIRTWQTLAILSDHTREVKRVKFSPYTKALATTSADGTAKLWNTELWHCFDTLDCNSEGEHEHCFDVCWNDEAEFLVTASHDCQWRLWIPDI